MNLKQIWIDSNPNAILNDLIRFYQDTLTQIDAKELYSSYTATKSNSIRYKFNKAFFSIIVMELKKQSKPKRINVDNETYVSIVKKLKFPNFKFNSKSIQENIEKLLKYNDIELLNVYKSITKRMLIRIPKLDTLDLYQEFATSNKPYPFSLNDLLISYMEIDLGDYDNYERSNFYLRKACVNTTLLSNEQYRSLLNCHISKDNLEFFLNYKPLSLKHLNSEEIEEAKKINLIQRSEYNRLRNLPIFILEYLNLTDFYNTLKMQNSLNSHSLEYIRRAKNKHSTIIYFSIFPNVDKKKLDISITNDFKFSKSNYVKLPKKRNLIMYVKNKHSIESFFQEETPITESPISPYSFNLVLKRVKYFDLKSLEPSKSSYNSVNLLEEYYNRLRYNNNHVEFGVFRSLKGTKTKKSNTLNMDNIKNSNTFDTLRDYNRVLERTIVYQNRKKDLKHYKKQKRRIVVINEDTSEFEIISKEIETFTEFFFYYVKDLISDSHKTFSKTIEKFRTIQVQDVSDHEDLMNYIRKIFLECFFNIEFSESFKKTELTDQQRRVNKIISYKPKVKIQKKRIVVKRDLGMSEYIKEQFKNVDRGFQNLFEQMSNVDFISESYDNMDLVRIPLTSKKYYFFKIMILYYMKLNEYTMGYKVNLLKYKQFNNLRIYLKSVLYNYNNLYN